MRRGTGEWQQYVFKIVDNHLQCLSLKEVSICICQERAIIVILNLLSETPQGDSSLGCKGCQSTSKQQPNVHILCSL